MVAIRTPRIRTGGRTKLQTVIPLDTPLHVFIDPSAACNFKCNFCFHADPRNKHHGIMEWDTFTKTINQLHQFPRKLKAIRLYGFGEPLLNRNLSEMVAYTKDAKVTEFVEFTTNGLWLNPPKNRSLVSAGLDAITISVPGISRESIRAACNRPVDFDLYIRNITDFYNNKGNCRLHIKTTNAALRNKGDEERFYELFENICDEISIDNVVPIWPGIPGKSFEDCNIYRGKIEPVNVCPYLFYHLTIHANGDISTCFVDWDHQNVLGNVNTNTLYDIWNGKELYFIRKNQLKGVKEGICVDCPQLVYGQPDNIDPYKEEILRRLS